MGMHTYSSPAIQRLRKAITSLCWAATAVFATACNSPVEPRPDTAGLAIGQEASPVGNDVLFVTFLEVIEDTRCPTRVQCVSAGDAVVRFGYRFGRGPTVPFVLRLNAAPRDTAIDRYRVVFDSLTPRAELPDVIIPPSSYRAWISFRTLP